MPRRADEGCCPTCGLFSPCKTCGKPRLGLVPNVEALQAAVPSCPFDCKGCSECRPAPTKATESDTPRWTRGQLVALAQDAFQAGRESNVERIAYLIARICS